MVAAYTVSGRFGSCKNVHGAARVFWNSLKFCPGRPAIRALIDAGARAGKNVRRVILIDGDAHNVRIIHHALMNGSPGLPAVDGFPWQVIGARVNRIGVVRVNGDGVEVAQVVVVLRGDAHPMFSGILGAIHAVDGACDKRVRVRGRLRQSRARCVLRGR